jgi:iron complex outermembrane receptor protein
LADNQLDITPGISLNYFSDFDFKAFPGIDIGYSLSETVRVYGNVGYTYRVPTYTDLYYIGRTDLGNANLVPEEAISEELGVKFFGTNLNAVLAVFHRSSDNLIDYTRDDEADKWQATNLKNLNTTGVELQLNYRFSANEFDQNINFGYTYLNEDLKAVKANFSKYVINSLKHHFTSTIRTQFFKNLSQTIVYKHAERYTGSSYDVVDVQATLNLGDFDISVMGNNIFNAEYVETGLVPMPKGNVLLGVNYRF